MRGPCASISRGRWIRNQSPPGESETLLVEGGQTVLTVWLLILDNFLYWGYLWKESCNIGSDGICQRETHLI
jgi:hypothetical protein